MDVNKERENGKVETVTTPKKKNDRMLQTLDSVIIGEKIGSGANGSVYLATYNSRKVAVKVIDSSEMFITDDKYKSFVKEAKLMLKLTAKKHANLVMVYAICISKELPAIVMEYADLGTLLQVLRSSEKLELNNVDNLTIGIARGIQYLHKNDIIHRDIAARNILLKESGVPMISDFGLSREVVQGEEYLSTGKDSLPLKWMAPEAIKLSHFTRATDIWSFGVTIWEIVTRGSEPHETIDVTEAKIQIRDYFLTPIIPSDVDPTMKVIMQQCWYKDPDMRPSPKDIMEMVKEKDF